MISKQIAALQVGRLGQMIGYPRAEKEALGELILAACAAKDEEICKRVIGDFIATANSETRCPMPADIRRAMYAADRPEYYEQKFAESPAVTCGACSDTGAAGGIGEPWRLCECAAGMQLNTDHPNRIEQLNRMNTAKLPQPSERRMRSTAAITEILERV